MTTITLPDRARDLAQRWAALRAEQPKLRIRDAAAALDASEAELLATQIADGTVIPLDTRFREILARMPELGRVMALTRNPEVVHERKGRYESVDVTGHAGLVVGPDIDLRIFFSAWKSAFAIDEATPNGPRRSLQFFDAHGDSIHKVFLQEDSDAEAFARIVADHRAAEGSGFPEVVPATAPAADKPDDAIDVDGFRAAWDALEDTHDFFGMLRRFGVGRVQALRLAGEPRAKAVDAATTRAMLEAASARNLPIMVFVGNPGCIQIHTGNVKNVKVMGPWLNVMDPDFNLHLREDAIASAWFVRKPTRDGVVTSLEIFNAAGDNLALFFGKRKPGVPEDTAWRALAAELGCPA